mgnify:CR=1 FL=1
MKRFYALLNIIVIFAVIVVNYFAGSTGLGGNTVSSVSAKYDTLFAPAGYAFAIWGVIYLGLLSFGIFQLVRVFSSDKEDDFVLAIGPWLTIANLANMLWIWSWLSENLSLSVILMVAILFSLIIIVLRLNMERWDAPFPIIAWVWWPICIYIGWITVATVANYAAYLVMIDWLALFNPVTWTVVMVIVATIINLLMIITRNMREFAVVGVWAISAIAVRQWGDHPTIQWTALVCALVLLVAISIHGYRNRATAPHLKFREYYK